MMVLVVMIAGMCWTRCYVAILGIWTPWVGGRRNVERGELLPWCFFYSFGLASLEEQELDGVWFIVVVFLMLDMFLLFRCGFK